MVDVTKSDATTQAFVGDVSSRSVNIIAEQDLVSRVGTDNQFVDAWMKDSIPALVDEKAGWKPIPNLLFWVVDLDKKMSTLYEKGKDNEEMVVPFLEAIAHLRHPAPLVIYKDYKSKP